MLRQKDLGVPQSEERCAVDRVEIAGEPGGLLVGDRDTGVPTDQLEADEWNAIAEGRRLLRLVETSAAWIVRTRRGPCALGRRRATQGQRETAPEGSGEVRGAFQANLVVDHRRCPVLGLPVSCLIMRLPRRSHWCQHLREARV
jgi:hypothetical protein